jgi:hypothetical protein
MLARQGFSNSIIAEELSLTQGLVKCHLHTIFEKLDVRSRTDLIVRFDVSQQSSRPVEPGLGAMSLRLAREAEGRRLVERR